MLTGQIHEKVKELTKKFNTTQASLTQELVRFALDHVTEDDLGDFALETAKPKGRKPKAATEVVVPEVVAAETAPTPVEA
jgi:hypothetical protein